MKETLAEQKDRLLATREDYKQALLNEVKDAKNDLLATKDKVLMEAKSFKDDLVKTKDWVLLVGGVVLIGYVALRGIAAIVSAFSQKDEKQTTIKEVIIEKPYQVYNPQEEEKETFFSPIIKAIKKEMTMFLLGLAKQALLEFLGRMQQKDTKN
jgi:uncharacterized membrane protein